MGMDLMEQRVCFFGKLSGMSRKDATTLVRQYGGQVVPQLDDSVNILVIGEAELLGRNWLDLSSCQDAAAQNAFERSGLEIVAESDFWRSLHEQQWSDSMPERVPLYTPSMIAELLNVPVATIRLWQRRGLLVPVRQVGKLPYFGSRDLIMARRIAALVESGLKIGTIARKLGEFQSSRPVSEPSDCDWVPAPSGHRILLREGDRLIDHNGQRYFDFGPDFPISKLMKESESDSSSSNVDHDSLRKELSEAEGIREFDRNISGRVVELCEEAWQLEEEGRWPEAIRLYRGALIAGGEDPGICFQLAELLEQQGDDIAARERYYMVLELDEDNVEARANLGRVLARLGELEEAAAALEGAIACHEEYLDAHYELGRLYYKMKRFSEAEDHLRFYLSATPDSPRAEEIEFLLDHRPAITPS